MKVTFVLPGFNLHGGTRIVAGYADRLRRRGHDVLVAAPPPRAPSLPARLRGLLRGRGWPRGPGRRPSHFDGLDIPCRTLDRWRPVEDRDLPDADVVVATWWLTAEWVARLSSRKGAKSYLIQMHEAAVEGMPAERVEATWRLPLRKIVVSRWLAELARDHFGVDDVALVPNAVDLEVFHAEPRDKRPEPTVGLLYSHERHKATDLVLRALDGVTARVPGLRVVAFGIPPVDDRLPLPPGASYRRSPPQDRLRTIYERCDVWVSGSTFEGFNLPPLEAMACRCPVVSTRNGAMPDLIEDGVNGHLVDVGDLDALTDRTARVLELPAAAWRAMSDAARRTAARYTWDDATDLFEAALRSAVDHHRAGSYSNA
ncbi:MAG TPA: glycosyltransferase family 4 protein [Isosphaeraceae bacterium]|jgi:glycosyltransferase involved in cell wall biosynthesis|nr:glycosyltransferase family 4 protein [Isosphaeraceae bacterium]